MLVRILSQFVKHYLYFKSKKTPDPLSLSDSSIMCRFGVRVPFGRHAWYRRLFESLVISLSTFVSLSLALRHSSEDAPVMIIRIRGNNNLALCMQMHCLESKDPRLASHLHLRKEKAVKGSGARPVTRGRTEGQSKISWSVGRSAITSSDLITTPSP